MRLTPQPTLTAKLPCKLNVLIRVQGHDYLCFIITFLPTGIHSLSILSNGPLHLM